MATLKYSRQRESIKEYLANTKEHPTADMVYMHIKQIYPNISLGTVYRNLNLLVEQGEVKKISHGSGIDRFDADIHGHYHFVCKECSNIIDLDIVPSDISHINEIAGRNFSGQIEGNSTFFYGLCADCNQKH